MTDSQQAAVPHSKVANEFLKNEPRALWHDQALWHVRQRRDKSVHEVPDWEALRTQASAVKLHMLSRMEKYLLEFEANAIASGASVHWAEDGKDLNACVLKILKDRDVRRIVKSKSMLTEECGLNHVLEENGMHVTDTDLGEWIVQLRKESPSHIVLPAIHIKKEEVGELFADTIGTERGNSDPDMLTRAACDELRKRYPVADAAISGANFLIAESGATVICTNEGNADLGVTLAPIHIVCVGIEKLIPKVEDLGIFLRLLARSATGQPITTYSSYLVGPQPGAELHIVLVDNGRTRQLADPEMRSALSCIRCGACLNTCPVYRRSGGASYGWAIPGPIGAVLAPYRFPDKFASLPFASSLCGSCTAVCPVKIPLHEQLLILRDRLTRGGQVPVTKRAALSVGGKILSSVWSYERLGKIGRAVMRLLPKRLLNSRIDAWTRHRDLPPIPKESFRDWYRRERPGKGGGNGE